MAINIAFRAGEQLFDAQGQLTVDAAARLNALATLANAAVAKDTGTTDWTVATGTASRATFDTATVTLPQLAERFMALEIDLLANGTIK
jgi:hypothetical protein